MTIGQGKCYFSKLKKERKEGRKGNKKNSKSEGKVQIKKWRKSEM